MRRRWSATVPVLLGPVMLAAACAGQPSYLALPAPAAPGPISGTVVDGHGRPIPGLTVAIGAEKTTSDGSGRFSFPVMPAGYDLVIAGPDATHATVYQGLGRRDPIVEYGGPHPHPAARSAQILVTLTGNDAPQAWWQVHFVSAAAFAAYHDKPAKDETLTVRWDGPDTITGVVMALATQAKGRDMSLAMFAQRPITVHDGQTATIDLAPARVGVVRRPRPDVTEPKEEPGIDWAHTTEEYRLPGAGLAFKGSGPSGDKYDTPDLRAFGLQICAYSFLWNPYVRTSRTQCDADAAKRLSQDLPSPPAFTAPAWDTLAAPGLRFTWSPVPNAIYRLMLLDQSHTSAEHPMIEIFTAQTTASWPDLSAVGVAFPAPLASYAAIIGTRGPYAVIDQMVGPQGFGDPAPRDRWSTESKELSVPVRPPLGKEEAACKFRETVICGPSGNPMSEFYRLSVMNRKIQTYPEFAAAVNVHCVSDCPGARAYVRAYATYSAEHPGFDKHEPMPVQEPEPLPPPEMIEEMRRHRR